MYLLSYSCEVGDRVVLILGFVGGAEFLGGSRRNSKENKAAMSRRRVVVKQQKPQGGGIQAAMKEVTLI